MRNAFGYILGFLVFVAGIPAVMWWMSGRPFPWAPALPWAIFAVILMILGLALSIWSIVHMRKVGEGNPFDVYNHEVAPRTKHLMTDGPYGFSRNPMLLGIYVYDIGILIWSPGGRWPFSPSRWSCSPCRSVRRRRGWRLILAMSTGHTRPPSRATCVGSYDYLTC